MKLTKLQLKALAEMAKHPVDKSFMPATVRSLIGLRLADKRMSYFTREFVITEAGRTRLLECETRETKG